MQTPIAGHFACYLFTDMCLLLKEEQDEQKKPEKPDVFYCLYFAFASLQENGKFNQQIDDIVRNCEFFQFNCTLQRSIYYSHNVTNE